MSLRTRLLLGYGYLVLLIVLAAGGAAVGFFNLSKGIDQILQENVRSLTSATEMLESLERQDSATLAALVQGGVDPEVRDDFAEASATFEKALADARGNVTIEGEEELLGEIGRDYDDYVELRQSLLSQEHEQPLVAYNQQTHPTFNEVKQSVLELLEMNRAAMVVADRTARQEALQNGVWLGILVTVALLSLILLSRALHKYLISRLTYFKQVSEAIAAGDTRRRFQLGYSDELSSIARHFNAAIDAQEELRSQAQGKLNQQRQLLIGVLEQWPAPVALIGLDGSLIASTMGKDSLDDILGQRRWIQTDGRDLLSVHKVGDEAPEAGVELASGKMVRFRLMVAGEKRPVGWLATLG
jgi:hypothetical protein